jgi:electron transport complex protein RnfD
MTEPEPAEPAHAPTVHVAPSPHLKESHRTTGRMMLDVLIGLSPAILASLFFYRQWALLQLLLCVGTCLATEAIFARARGREIALWDLSAAVTGVILALSLPWNTPWFVSIIGSAIAISIGKMIFGGLGMNLFNPAMVGRAFVMLSFAGAVAAPAYVADADSNAGHESIVSINEQMADQEAADALSGATPLTAYKENGEPIPLASELISSVYSSLGERGIFVLIGALFLLIRGTIAWEIPTGAVAAVVAIAGWNQLTGGAEAFGILHHLFGGAFLLGAFFIATDPVTSPVTPAGRWIFGVLFGLLVMLLRLLSNYPEGVMFSILMVNALVPLINRWTIPRPFGGPVPEKK